MLANECTRLRVLYCGRCKCLHVYWWFNVKERHLICFKQELDGNIIGSFCNEDEVTFLCTNKSQEFSFNRRYSLLPSSESNWIYYCPSKGGRWFLSMSYPPLTWNLFLSRHIQRSIKHELRNSLFSKGLLSLQPLVWFISVLYLLLSTPFSSHSCICYHARFFRSRLPSP